MDLFASRGMTFYAAALVAVILRWMAIRAAREPLVVRGEDAERMGKPGRRPRRINMAVLADCAEPGVVLQMRRRILRRVARVAAYGRARRVREIPGRVPVAQLACGRVLRRVRHMACGPPRQMARLAIRG